MAFSASLWPECWWETSSRGDYNERFKREILMRRLGWWIVWNGTPSSTHNWWFEIVNFNDEKDSWPQQVETFKHATNSPPESPRCEKLFRALHLAETILEFRKAFDVISVDIIWSDRFLFLVQFPSSAMRKIQISGRWFYAFLLRVFVSQGWWVALGQFEYLWSSSALPNPERDL